ncbi:hypothetical protein INR49_021436 [Caranx melampygus]|nr:hypothetical protein INR49_021436 [Caranx melampygus]
MSASTGSRLRKAKSCTVKMLPPTSSPLTSNDSACNKHPSRTPQSHPRGQPNRRRTDAPTMKVLIYFEGSCEPFDVPPEQTVGAMKRMERCLIQLSNDKQVCNYLEMSYAGAALQDSWALSDVGITSGSAIRCLIKLRVALYIAASLGHLDLADWLLERGVHAEEPVGVHPYRQWCHQTAHQDTGKCPIYVAVECGQLLILKVFTTKKILTLACQDPAGRDPLNIAVQHEITEAEKQLKRNSKTSQPASRFDSQRVGMAAPRPIKGILKNKNSGTNVKSLPDEVSADAPEQTPGLSEDDQQKKSQKWDEMNILATYHPADKDYGLMKIDEPSTPYNRMVGDDDDEGALSDSEGHGGLAADDLVSKLAAAEGSDPRFMKEEEESSEEEEEELTPEEQAKKKHFQMMRKMHYNEGLNIKLARQLIASELEDDDDGDEEMRDDTEEAREDTEETEEINVDPPQEADSLDS